MYAFDISIVRMSTCNILMFYFYRWCIPWSHRVIIFLQLKLLCSTSIKKLLPSTYDTHLHLYRQNSALCSNIHCTIIAYLPLKLWIEHVSSQLIYLVFMIWFYGEDILIFLTGQEEIESTVKSIRDVARDLPHGIYISNTLIILIFSWFYHTDFFMKSKFIHRFPQVVRVSDVRVSPSGSTAPSLPTNTSGL